MCLSGIELNKTDYPHPTRPVITKIAFIAVKLMHSPLAYENQGRDRLGTVRNANFPPDEAV